MCDANNVLDKDGISAMCVGAEMCVYLKSIGRTLYEQLKIISMLYGYHINNNSYLYCNKTDVLLNIFEHLRHFDKEQSDTRKEDNAEEKTIAQYSNKIKSQLGADENEPKDTNDDRSYVYPKMCGRYRIIGIRDLTVGIEADFRGGEQNKKPTLPCSKSNQMITFYFEHHCEVTLRASGTEPKIKWYSEIRKKKKHCQPTENEPMIDDDQFRKETKQELDDLIEILIEEFLKPEKNQFVRRETMSK